MIPVSPSPGAIAAGAALAVVALLVVAAAPEPTPASTLVIDPPRVSVGGVAVVRFAGVPASGSVGERALDFFESDGASVALVGIDLDQEPAALPVRVRGPGAATAEATLVVEARSFPEERLKVARRYVDPDPETLERILREKARLDSLWLSSDPERHWSGTFRRPATGRPGSAFGLRRFFNGEPRSPHGGIDVKAPTGTAVHATNRGRVALAGDLHFTGKTVVLDHGLGLFSLYAHLSTLGVSEGEMVEIGQRIGAVGATGRVTGPHLHFAFRHGEARIDPEAVLDRRIDGAGGGQR